MRDTARHTCSNPGAVDQRHRQGVGHVRGGPLYRYFASRDDLLTELVVDAHHDLASALDTAARRARRLRPAERLRAFAAAYRDWANTEPHRCHLLFTAPLPGYDAQSARLVTASRAAMAAVTRRPLTPPAR